MDKKIVDSSSSEINKNPYIIETVEDQDKRIDIIPLLVSLGKSEICTKNINATATYIRLLSYDSKPDQFQALINAFNKSCKEEEFIISWIDLFEALVSSYKMLVPVDIIQLFTEYIKNGPTLFNKVITFFISLCNNITSYAQHKLFEYFSKEFIEDVCIIIEEHIEDVDVSLCLKFMQFFLELYQDDIVKFLSLIKLTNHRRCACFFQFLLAASEYPDLCIPQLIEETVFDDLSYIKVESYEHLLNLFLKLLPNSERICELLNERNFIFRSIVLAMPLHKISTKFPHLQFLMFCRDFIKISNPMITLHAIDTMFYEYINELFCLQNPCITRELILLSVDIIHNHRGIDLLKITSTTSANIIRKYCLKCDADEELDAALLVLSHFLSNVTEDTEDLEFIQNCILDDCLFNHINEIDESSCARNSIRLFFDIGGHLRDAMPKLIFLRDEKIKKEKKNVQINYSDLDESEISSDSYSISDTSCYSADLISDESIEEDSYYEYSA